MRVYLSKLSRGGEERVRRIGEGIGSCEEVGMLHKNIKNPPLTALQVFTIELSGLALIISFDSSGFGIA